MDPKNAPKGAVRSSGTENGQTDEEKAAAAKAKADAEAAAEAAAKEAAELAEKKAKEEAAEVDAKAKEEAEAAAKDKPEYYVADGKAITSLRGILDAGAEVKVTDFYGSGDGAVRAAHQKAALAAQVAAGNVIHNPKPSEK